MLGDSLRRRHQREDEQKRDPREKTRGERTGGRPGARAAGRPGGSTRRGRFRWWHWVLAALVVLGGSFGVGYLLSTQVLFPVPETAGTGIAVPALYGEMRDEAEEAIRSAGLVLGDVTELASMDSEPGRVLAQDPVPGQQLRAGAAVSIAVSVGPPELRVPPIAGMDVRAARELLESVGFDVDVRDVRTAGVAAGIVTRTDPAAGDPRTLPTTVTLLVNAGPPPDTLPEPESPFGEAGSPTGGPGSPAGESVPPRGGGRP